MESCAVALNAPAILKRLQKEGAYALVAGHGAEDELIPVAMGQKLG